MTDEKLTQSWMSQKVQAQADLRATLVYKECVSALANQGKTEQLVGLLGGTKRVAFLTGLTEEKIGRFANSTFDSWVLVSKLGGPFSAAEKVANKTEQEKAAELAASAANVNAPAP